VELNETNQGNDWYEKGKMLLIICHTIYSLEMEWKTIHHRPPPVRQRARKEYNGIAWKLG